MFCTNNPNDYFFLHFTSNQSNKALPIETKSADRWQPVVCRPAKLSQCRILKIFAVCTNGKSIFHSKWFNFSSGCYTDNFLNLIRLQIFFKKNVIMYLFYGLHKMYLQYIQIFLTHQTVFQYVLWQDILELPRKVNSQSCLQLTNYNKLA